MSENKTEKINSLHNTYEQFKNIVCVNSLDNLKELSDSFKRDITHTKQQNRLLRFGIIGQIKRGKSSFLNTLLFKGQDILPKAATPMTAALTRISYSEQPQATVEFYTEQEWQKVATTAAKVQESETEYEKQLAEFRQNQTAGRRVRRQRPPVKPTISDEEKACCELVKMVEQSGINVTDYLGKEHQIEHASDNSDLVQKLSEFVGADGRFTPIVKSTELKLNVDGLQDIEVVDTPGMNDPIISRGRRTQEFIGQCDVVFFLSYCGQFLDMHDMGLLAQNIPNKGIKDIVLIGSVFDNALLDEYDKYASIQQALPSITNKLASVAKQNVESVCRQGQAHDEERYIFNALTAALPPIFISSRCADLARKGTALSEEEQHSLTQLNNMYSDFEFTSQILEVVSNFKPVREKLEKVRANKEQILSDRLNDVVKGAERSVRSLLQKIQDDILHRKKLLEEGDLDALASQQKETIRRIEQGQTKITAAFEKQMQTAQSRLSTTLNELKQVSLDAKRVETQSGSKRETYEVARTVSDSTWYKPWSWGSTRTVYDTHYRTVNYSYANVQDAVDKLETFVYKTDERLNQAVSGAINIQQMQMDIKAVIRGMFDFSDESFDPESVLLPLENALSRLTLPTIALNMDHHIDVIRQQFTSAEVQNDDIAKLRQEQGRIVGVLMDAINSEVDSNISAMLSKLESEKQSFIPELTKDLTEQVERLSKDLKDREQVLSEYQAVLQLLEQDLK